MNSIVVLLVAGVIALLALAGVRRSASGGTAVAIVRSERETAVCSML